MAMLEVYNGASVKRRKIVLANSLWITYRRRNVHRVPHLTFWWFILHNNNKLICTAQIRQGCKCAYSRQFWRRKFSVYLL